MAQQGKKSTKVWIAAGAGCLVLICLVIAVIAAVVLITRSNPNNEARNLFQEADAKYSRAQKIVKDIAQEVSEFSKNPNSDTSKQLVAQSEHDSKRAKEDLDEAKALYGQVSDLSVSDEINEKASLNIEAVNEMQKGLDLFNDWLGKASKNFEFIDKFVDAYKRSNTARKALYTAVNGLNTFKKERTLLYAQKSQIFYKEAKTMALEAKKIKSEPSNEILLQSIDHLSKCADLAIELGKIGRDGDVTKYNSARDKYESHRKSGQALLPKIPLFDNKDAWIKENITVNNSEVIDTFDSADKKKAEADAIEL